MKENLYSILSAAIPVIVIVLGWLGVLVRSLIKANIGETNYNKALSFIKTIVYSVQQTMGSGNGIAKKKVVLDIVTQKLTKYLTSDEINHLIEEAVFQMNQQKLLPIDSSAEQSPEPTDEQINTVTNAIAKAMSAISVASDALSAVQTKDNTDPKTAAAGVNQSTTQNGVTPAVVV